MLHFDTPQQTSSFPPPPFLLSFPFPPLRPPPTPVGMKPKCTSQLEILIFFLFAHAYAFYVYIYISPLPAFLPLLSSYFLFLQFLSSDFPAPNINNSNILIQRENKTKPLYTGYHEMHRERKEERKKEIPISGAGRATSHSTNMIDSIKGSNQIDVDDRW